MFSNKIKFILISGKRYAGKDEFAKLLKSLHPETCLIRSLGFYPKQMYSYIMNLDLERLMYDREYKEKHREGIIYLAMRKREENQNYWVNCLLKSCQKYQNKIILVPDFRFKNEREFLFRNNNEVKTIRLVCNEQIRSQRGWKYDEKIDNTLSETELKDKDPSWNYIIHNNTNSLELLSEYTVNFLNKIFK